MTLKIDRREVRPMAGHVQARFIRVSFGKACISSELQSKQLKAISTAFAKYLS